MLRRGDRFVVPALLRRLDESLAQRADLLQLLLRELVEPIGKVLHGFIEPLALMIGLRADDSALHDVLEQLVTGFIERRRDGRRRVTTGGFLRHVLGLKGWNDT